jgi:nucleoid DNA-binding protein
MTEVTKNEANRKELEALVKEKLSLPTAKAATETVEAVLGAIHDILAENVKSDGFKFKIHGFGQFRVIHKPAKMVKIPKTGEQKMGQAKNKIKFLPSSQLRELEKV